jgi:tagatose 6-phosphate kinase
VLTVTLNAALDVTYTVDAIRVAASHAVSTVTSQAGGKGVNVARVLCALGHEVTVTGLLAGPTGRQIGEDLARTPLHDAFLTVSGDSRRTITVVDGAGATAFNEPGDRLEIDDWPTLEARLGELFQGHDVVVASGSLPPAAPTNAYARITAAAHRAGCRVIVDAAGPALLAAASAGADLVKPNAEELAMTTGRSSVEEGAALLLERGAGAVITSLGADGVEYRSGQETLIARPAERVAGNPTGAGDALVAALALGLAADTPPMAAIAFAVALSAAAVAHPLAGHVSVDLVEQFHDRIIVEEVPR